MTFLKEPFFTKHLKKIGVLLASFALIISLLLPRYEPLHTTLTLSVDDAISYASDVIEDLEQSHKKWSIATRAHTIAPHHLQSHAYLWQTGGKHLYKELLGSYLQDTCWEVRYALFEGKPDDRVEEFRIFVGNNGEIVRIQHLCSDNTPGETISKPHARGIALQTIQKLYGVTPYNLKEVSALEIEKPARKDFIFTFCDTSVHLPQPTAQARITIYITGDEISDCLRSMYTPESWLKAHTTHVKNLNFLYLIALIIFGILTLTAYAMTMHPLVNSFSMRELIICCIPILALALIQFFSRLPVDTFLFSTEQTYTKQFITLATIGITLLFFLNIMICSFTSQLGVTLPFTTEKNSYSTTITLGVLLGLVTSSLLLIVDFFSPRFTPLVGDLSILSYHSEIAGKIVNSIFLMLTPSALSLALGFYALQLKNKQRYLFLVLSLLSGLIMLFINFSIESIPGILIGSVITTLIITLIINLYSIKNILVIIPALTIITLVKIIRETLCNAYGAVQFHAILASIALILFTLWWFSGLWSKKKIN